MSSETAIDIRIVQMGAHFLYLPLYYAASRSFFGKIPAKYKIAIVDPPEHSDDSAFNALMDVDSPFARGIEFAICDPAQIFLNRDRFSINSHTPVLLAGLVTNGAFWAVDKGTFQIRRLEDIAQYDKIIAYRPHTTSHGIAMRVFRQANVPESDILGRIISVDPGKELVQLRNTEGRVVALTASPLNLQELLENHSQYHIDYEFGKSVDYSGVLVTGLLSRRDVVDKHGDLVDGILEALQIALMHVQLMNAEVISVACSRFNEDAARIKRSLERANASGVFPHSIKISHVHWLNNIKSVCDSISTPYSQVASEAESLYERTVAPFNARAENIVNNIYRGILDDPQKQTARRSLLGRICCVSLVILWILAASSLHDPAAMAKLFAITVVTAFLFIVPYFYSFAGLSRRLAGHYLLSLLMIVTGLCWFHAFLTLETSLVIFIALAGADVTVIFAGRSGDL